MRGLNWTGPAFSCGRPLSVLCLKTETWKQHHTAINTTGLLFCSRDRKRDLRKRWRKSAKRESKTEKKETRQKDRGHVLGNVSVHADSMWLHAGLFSLLVCSALSCSFCMCEQDSLVSTRAFAQNVNKISSTSQRGGWWVEKQQKSVVFSFICPRVYK